MSHPAPLLLYVSVALVLLVGMHSDEVHRDEPIGTVKMMGIALFWLPVLIAALVSVALDAAAAIRRR